MEHSTFTTTNTDATNGKDTEEQQQQQVQPTYLGRRNTASSTPALASPAARSSTMPSSAMPAPASVLAKQKKLLDQSPEGVWLASVDAAAIEMATFANGSPLALILDALDERPELRIQLIGTLAGRLANLSMRGAPDHECS